MNMEIVSNEVRVKDETIFDSQTISDIREATSRNNQQSIKHEMKVKEETIEEEKFSATKEFANKTSIAFLDEETTTKNQPKTSNNDTNNPINK